MSKAPPVPNDFRKEKIIVFVTVFLDLVGFSIIFPIFPELMNYYLRLEGSESLIGSLVQMLESFAPEHNRAFYVTVLFGGLLGSLYSILQFLFAPVWGRLSDCYGRRNILKFTILGTSLAYLLWIFSGSFWIFVLARVIGGIMAGNLSVASAAMADLTESKDRAKGMALIGVAFGLGFVIGPAMGGLASLWGPVGMGEGQTGFALNPFSFPAMLAFALAVLNTFWVFRVFRETLPVEKRQPAFKLRQLVKLRSANPRVRLAVRTYFCLIFAFSGMEFTLSFLAVERLAYSPHQIAVVFLFVGFVMILTQGFIVRRYAHQWGELNCVFAGFLSMILGMVFLAIAMDTLFFYVGLAFMSVGIALSNPSLNALVSLYAGEKEQGSELGIFRSAGSLARAFGPLFGAGIFWYAGSDVAYLMGAGLILATLIYALTLPKPILPKTAANDPGH